MLSGPYDGWDRVRPRPQKLKKRHFAVTGRFLFRKKGLKNGKIIWSFEAIIAGGEADQAFFCDTHYWLSTV